MPKGAGGTVSPRRLSRARAGPPPPSQPSHTNSVSSSSSTRAERSTRSHNKTSSPHKSSTPQSLTSEELSEQTHAATSEPPQLRRSKRTHDNDDDVDAKAEDLGEDEIIEDEETTRCICGHMEYPGPPDDTTSPRATKGVHTTNQDDQSEVRGLFIQCDTCEVWQHGGCVSIMEDSAVPDNYYCEECKPELHELLRSSIGQKFSHYLPVWSKSQPKVPRKGSVEKDDKTKIPKEKERLARNIIPEAGAKRRSTMNSRAAYDEDEVLRKVLEESKTEGSIGAENGSRKGKRNRDGSEDIRSDAKRQRTASSVVSSHFDEESGEDSDLKALRKAPRGAAAQSQREKDLRDRERERSEAANKRKGRAERRRGDDSDPQEPDSAKPSANASPVEPDIPDSRPLVALTSTSKRGGKRPGAGRGKSGTNQAPTPAEDKVLSPQASNPADGRDTPVPPVTVNGNHPHIGVKRSKRGQAQKEESGESDRDNIHTNGTGGTNGNHHPEKHDGGGTRRKAPSMSELKRRAAAMLEWVEIAKDEMARGTASLGGSASPPVVKLTATMGDLGSIAEGLHTSLLDWQVEHGGG